MKSPGPTWAGFCVCVLMGVALAFATVSLIVLAIVPVLIGLIVAVRRPALLSSGFGLLTGVGLLAVYVAFLQRQGPGTVCWQTATGSGCDEYLNPWPWLLVGVLLASVGVVAHARRMRRAHDASLASR